MQTQFKRNEAFDSAVAFAPQGNDDLSRAAWDEIQASAAAAARPGQQAGSLSRLSSEAPASSALSLWGIPSLSIGDRAAYGLNAENQIDSERQRVKGAEAARIESGNLTLIGPESSRLDEAGIKASILFLFDKKAKDEEKILALHKLSANDKWELSSPDAQSYQIKESKNSDCSYIYELFSKGKEEHAVLHGRMDKNGNVTEARSTQAEGAPAIHGTTGGYSEISLSPAEKQKAIEDSAGYGQTKYRGPSGKSFEIDASRHGTKDEVSILESDRIRNQSHDAEKTAPNSHPAEAPAGNALLQDSHGKLNTSETNSPAIRAELSSSAGLLLTESNSARMHDVQTNLEKDQHAEKSQRLLSKMFKLLKDIDRVQARLRAERQAERQKRNLLDDPDVARGRQKRELNRARRFESAGLKHKAAEWAQRLRQEALKNIPGDEEKRAFLQQIDQFEQKAARNRLTPHEVKETFKQLSKLLSTAVAAIDLPDRVLAARSFLSLLVEPGGCNQGQHNTCNVTTLAERNIRRHPAKLAEILKTTALTGAWVAPDGKKIRIAPVSLVPGGEEQYFPLPFPGERAYAMQILNNVLVNDITQRRVAPEFYVQQKPQSIDDSGERLVYADGSAVNKEAPAIYVEEMDAAQRRLTGESKFLIFNSYFKSQSANLVPVGSVEELGRVLAEMKEQDRLPAILYVDTRNREFGGDGKTGDGRPRAHVVSITDFNPGSGQTCVSNQWGPAWNRNYSLAALYRSTLPIEC